MNVNYLDKIFKKKIIKTIRLKFLRIKLIQQKHNLLLLISQLIPKINLKCFYLYFNNI